jgi:tRNA pseudouridine13 synthase
MIIIAAPSDISTSNMSDEQPRKRVRLTGPDESTAPDVDAAVQAQLDQEKTAGIHVFASKASGFGGIVKKRYTDFLVNEISTSGTVYHLDELTGPAVKAVKKIENEVEAEEKANPPEPAPTPTPAPAPAKETSTANNAETQVKERIKDAIDSVNLSNLSYPHSTNI